MLFRNSIHIRRQQLPALHHNAAVTSGGRVLAVTALGQNLRAAVARAYEGVAAIRFEGAHYRKDIARRAFAR